MEARLCGLVDDLARAAIVKMYIVYHLINRQWLRQERK